MRLEGAVINKKCVVKQKYSTYVCGHRTLIPSSVLQSPVTEANNTHVNCGSICITSTGLNSSF